MLWAQMLWALFISIDKDPTCTYSNVPNKYLNLILKCDGQLRKRQLLEIKIREDFEPELLINHKFIFEKYWEEVMRFVEKGLTVNENKK